MSAKVYGTPGPRSIYPELCDSRSLARCGILANALWPRLIVRADDQGRMAGDAADVLGECFPKMLRRVTLAALREALVELERAGMIRLYEADGETYLQIVHWWSWQSYARRAYPSRLPAPDGWIDVVYGLPGQPRTYREAVGLDARKRPQAEPQDVASECAPEPQRADAEPQRADSVQPHARGIPSRPVPSRPNGLVLERVDSSLALATRAKEQPPDPADDPLDTVRAWLAQRRAAIDPGSRTEIELARLVDQHGPPAVIEAMAALGPGLRDGRQYVYGALKRLNPIPETRRAPPPKGWQRTEAEVAAAFARDAEDLDRVIAR